MRRRDGAHPSGLVVGDRLKDLLAGVHDERPVLHDRLADRPAAQEQDIERAAASVLAGAAVDPERLAGAEDRELARSEWRPFSADASDSAECVDERVEVRAPRQLEARSR